MGRVGGSPPHSSVDTCGAVEYRQWIWGGARREAAAARAGGSGTGKEEAREPDEEPELRRRKAPVAIGSAESNTQLSRRTAAAA
jgi:hypothetical protein